MTDEKTILNVEGMTCTSCALGVENQLKKMGATDIHVDFSLSEASFNKPEDLSAKEVADSVTKMGYYSTPLNYDKDEEKPKMSSVEKKFWFSLLFSIPLLFHMVLPHDAFLNKPLVQAIIAFPPFLLGIFHFGRSGYSSLKNGASNMDVLIFIGSTSAYFYSLWGTYIYFGTPEVHNFMFFETSSSIISLVLLGNVLEHRSVNKTTSAIKELSSLQAKTAKRIDSDGNIEDIKYSDIKIGDRLQVNTGDLVPMDGIIINGFASLNEAMISGESIPVDKTTEAVVIGGTLVEEGSFVMEATKTSSNTTLAKIIELVKGAQQNKPEIQKLGDRISAIFVPAVLGISLLTFLLAYFAFDLGMQQALMQSIAVLVISCPCAMGLATPTAVMVGIGRAAKNGILIKGGSTLEEIAKAKTIFFDKTGTLTNGNFKIKSLNVISGDKSEIESILFTMEQNSSHPIAKSICKELESKVSAAELKGVLEVKGKGLKAKDAQENLWEIGSFKMLKHLTEDDTHEIYIAQNNKLVATLDIEDEIKPYSKELIEQLNTEGFEVVLLSGDKKAKCDTLAKELNIKIVYAEQSPEDKLQLVDEYSQKGKTIMVGDGVNDAPSLAKANVGISFGDATDVSMSSAQIVLLGKDGLRKLPEALKIGALSLKTIKQNLFWAFFYNTLAIPVAALGFLSPMVAAFSMAFSDVVIIGNSLWLKRKK